MPQVPGTPRERVGLGVSSGGRLTLPGMTTPDVRLNTPELSAPTIRNQQVNAPNLRPGLKNPEAIRDVRMSDRGAGQDQQIARNLGSAADAMARVSMDMAVKINATVVDDALNDAREAARRITWGTADGKGGLTGGYRNLKGYEAISRESGKALDDEVYEDFDSALKDITKSKIRNADQRRVFEAQASQIGSQLRQGAGSHQAEQFETYHTGVYQGMVKNLTNDFALTDPTDITTQETKIAELDGAVATLAQNQGASAQELDVGQRAARSAAVAGLFDSVVGSKNYGQAQAILNTWSKNGKDGKPLIDANVALAMKLKLDGRVTTQVGTELGDEAWTTWAAPAFNAGPADNLQAVVLGLETRTRHINPKTGDVFRSPAGAFGIGQLMPETAKRLAKQLGRPELAALAEQPTKAGEAANLLLSRTELNNLVTQFKGDREKAMAAYNAGAGWLIGGKDSKGRPIEGALNIAARTGTDWRIHLPQETQNYIRNGVKALNSGGGQPTKPSKAALYQAVDDRTDDPDVRKAAYARIDQRFANAEFDERRGHEEGYASVIVKLQSNGGNVNAVTQEEWSRLRPQDRATAEAYGNNIVEGAYRTTDPVAYWEGIGAALREGTTPAQLEAFRPRMSEKDFNMIRGAYVTAQKPTQGQAPEDLDFARVDALVDNQLQYLGVNTKPGKDDSKEIAKLGAIRQFTQRYLMDLQVSRGKKFTDAELQQAVVEMSSRSQPFKMTVFGQTQTTGSQNVLSSEVRDLPTQTRARLTTELTKALGRKPTDAEMLQGYFRSQFYSNQPKPTVPRINWGGQTSGR